MEELDFLSLEKKWQRRWEDEGVFVVSEDSSKEKFYCLEMFPYPSGTGLHMGHAWNYTIGDIIDSFKRMKGFNVLHPMGYDSLGLPAENAAISAHTHPKEYTEKSVPTFTRQLKEIGLSYDWSRTFSTHDPSYYKWDQWIFLQMLKKGLAYQKVSNVNWCPKCNTVLANEQVQNGVCWRHEDTKVEIKPLKQWFLKITSYADELYEKIDSLDWPEKTKAMQKNWIGKSHGVEIDFDINGELFPVFTTRPDTVFGVTFLVIAAQHPRLTEFITKDQEKEVNKFLDKITSVSQKDIGDFEKEGVFMGSYAVNPATNEKIPLYAGNFVVADYGSGIVMAVPAHDQRDFEFAKKYSIPIKGVIMPEDKQEGVVNLFETLDRAYTGEGFLFNSGRFDTLKNSIAKDKISHWLAKEGVGRRVTNFRLRDWGIARQRYWGAPIPIIHCDKCGAVPVPEKDLPVMLPKNVTFGKGNPLETNEEWLKVSCPKCSGKATREPNTMDTFVNSSWYFLRYADPKNETSIGDKKKLSYWCPIDTYVGGAEHACMHLIYFRFYTKFLRDIGLISFGEPAKKLFHQGMLHGEGGVKMSKSRPETCVLPEDVSKEYGMDTARFFLSSLASPDKDVEWSDKGIIGSFRLIKRIFEHSKTEEKTDSEELVHKRNQAIKNVESYYDSFAYRKATIELRELFTIMEKSGSSRESRRIFLQLIAPICPHIAEELWEQMGNEGSISVSSWPKASQVKISKKKPKEDNNTKIVMQVKEVIAKTNSSPKKVTLYVMPFEVDKLDSKSISSSLNLPVTVFSVNDKKKVDPKGFSKKARPGKPGIYVE